jgi:hypothetical protein
MTQERAGEDALTVLRGIWAAQRRRGADPGDVPESPRVCKNMKHIGFGGMAGDPVDPASTAGPVGEDLRAAWRSRLAREGKLAPGASSVRELVFGEEAPLPRRPAP